ncbi:hypothetical protein CVS40_9297 [Lucilia cuprina]|nr:hypothetical protein CVS40_9297 [Lucilia cuprina]
MRPAPPNVKDIAINNNLSPSTKQQRIMGERSDTGKQGIETHQQQFI